MLLGEINVTEISSLSEIICSDFSSVSNPSNKAMRAIHIPMPKLNAGTLFKFRVATFKISRDTHSGSNSHLCYTLFNQP